MKQTRQLKAKRIINPLMVLNNAQWCGCPITPKYVGSWAPNTEKQIDTFYCRICKKGLSLMTYEEGEI